MIYRDNGLLLSNTNEWNAVICSDADGLEAILLSVVRQKENGKYSRISLIGGIQNMIQMNLSMKQRQNHRRREQTCVCQGGGESERVGVGVLGLADANWHI